uniref:CSON004416 protein n=1 Tax=Culicoides sonorensis TaxID=179676 RepID=A0A336MPR3_CULSO
MNKKSLFIAVLLTLIIENVQSQLFPIEAETIENIYDIQITTTRQSLDDCATRYYRYGRDNLASPVLGTPVELNKALLGDRNPYSTLDDEFAQIFDIIQVIRHEQYRSSLRYFDIALFKLSGNIRPHKTVLPACLWSDDNFLDFKELEAIGIDDNKTDKLEKVTLNPIDIESCKEFYSAQGDRKIPNGLVEHQICARDNKNNDLRQDTCLGDSGGPLQVKLLANGRMTSFIIGITSFGKACGFDAPGVYSSVAAFKEWIEAKTGISFEARKCALRYVSLREFQPGLLELSDRTSSDDGLSLQDYRSNWINSKIHIARDYRHKAYLGWYKENYIHWYCGASLISERFLLSAAHCMDNRPEIASVGGLRPHSSAEDHLTQKIEIEQIIIHPSYRQNEIYHDIALVKLKDSVKLSLDIVPACIWKKNELPTDTYEVVGWGSRTSNLFFIDLPVWEVGNDEVFPIVTSECNAECQVNKTKPLEIVLDHKINDEIRYLEVNSTILNNQACNEFYRKKNGNQIVDSQICIQNDLFSVPGICDLDVGGPVERKIWSYNEYDSYIFGVNSFGKNCGFGTPVVATRVSSYADWIEENVLGVVKKQPSSVTSRKNDNDQIVFIDEHEGAGSACTVPGDQESGVCTSLLNCPGFRENYSARNQQVKFCGFDPHPTICCPASLSSRSESTETRQCSNAYKEFRKTAVPGLKGIGRYENNKIFSHTAAIGFAKGNKVDYLCWGALIASDFVITTASCLSQARKSPSQVRLGNQNFGLSNEEQIHSISRVILHPLYQQNSFYNDIAMLKLTSPIRLTRNVVPACLWQSEDHIPFIGVVPGPTGTKDITYSCRSTGDKSCNAVNSIDKERKLLTMQNDLCQHFYNSDRTLPEGVISSQVCAQAEQINSTDSCIRTPGALYQKGIEENGVIVPYIVGLYSYDKNCHRDNPAIFTRISSFTNFITDKIKLG